MITLQKQAAGNVLIIAFVLSTLIVTVGLGVQKTLLGSLQRSADLLHRERAYYSAESGIEESILYLNQWELEHLEDYQPEVSLSEDQARTITIDNAVEQFQFVLGPEESTDFVLQWDPNEQALGDTAQNLSTFDIHAESLPGQTPDAGAGGQYLVTKCLGESLGASIQQVRFGINETASIGNPLANGLNDLCRISVRNDNVASQDDEQNLRRAMQFTVCAGSCDAGGGSQRIAPNRAQITVKGTSGPAEKIVTFGYGRDRSLIKMNYFRE